MRKTAKAILLVVVSLLGTVGLAIGAAFSAAFAFGAVALIVPGTGTPNANVVSGYLANTENYYLRDTACTGASCTLTGIDYPASFFPLAIIPGWCRSGPEGCDKWDESVGQGVNGGPLGPGLKQELADALKTTPEGGRDIVVFGYSQGGAVVSKVLNESDLTPEQKQRIQVVTIGGIENPDGGLWQRLAFLKYIPFLDVTFDPPMPVDPDLKTTTIGFEYDPVVYAPRYWGNPLALLNAFAALETVHGDYLQPTGNSGTPGSLPYGYTPPTASGPGTLLPQLDCSSGGHPENCRYDKAGNAYIMIPATSLPMYDLAVSLLPVAARPYAKPFVDLVTPVTKVLVDLGYDWSGDPGTPTPLSILPFNPNQNFIKVGIQLIGASVQGVEKFVSDLDNLGTGPSTTVAPRVQALGTLSRLPDQDALNAKAANVFEGAAVGEKKSGATVADGTSPVAPGAAQATNEQGQPRPSAGTPQTGQLTPPAQIATVGQAADQKADADHVVVTRTGGSQQIAAKEQTQKPFGDVRKQWDKSVNDVRKLFGGPTASVKKKDGEGPGADPKKDVDTTKGDTANGGSGTKSADTKGNADTKGKAA